MRLIARDQLDPGSRSKIRTHPPLLVQRMVRSNHQPRWKRGKVVAGVGVSSGTLTHAVENCVDHCRGLVLGRLDRYSREVRQKASKSFDRRVRLWRIGPGLLFMG